jgi:hypothetical protein
VREERAQFPELVRYAHIIAGIRDREAYILTRPKRKFMSIHHAAQVHIVQAHL